jgi:hypothetical protein
VAQRRQRRMKPRGDEGILTRPVAQ